MSEIEDGTPRPTPWSPPPSGAPKRPNRATRHTKTGFYQQDADADRMRGAYLNTTHLTGFNNLSEFIQTAVNEKVTGLERAYNNGEPWEPVGPGVIPQGKPRTVRPAAAPAITPIVREEIPMPEKPVQDLVDVIQKVRGELEEPQVFYSEDGKRALVMTHNHRDDVDDLRAYVYHAEWLPIDAYTYKYVNWEQEADIELPSRRTKED